MRYKKGNEKTKDSEIAKKKDIKFESNNRKICFYETTSLKE
jgi:hypothetical protein